MRYHLDTDFLVYALSRAGSERRRLGALGDSDDEIRMSAVAWYEFSRGPRTPEQLVTRNARDFAGIPDLRVEAAGPHSRGERG